MDAIERVLIFNSTVLVVWSIVFMPWVLRTSEAWLFKLHCTILLMTEIILFWNIYDFPGNVARGTFMFLLAIAGTYLVRRYDTRVEQKTNNRLRGNSLANKRQSLTQNQAKPSGHKRTEAV